MNDVPRSDSSAPIVLAGADAVPILTLLEALVVRTRAREACAPDSIAS